MKTQFPRLGISRRVLLSAMAVLPTAYASLDATSAPAQTAASGGQLPAWNDGPAKQAIFDFVRRTTDRSSPHYVLPEERVAVFDQDGTLWVEHPLYTQVVYCLERVPAVVAKKPALKTVEPFRVCPKSLSRITELSQHEADGGQSKESQCIAVEILKIFGKAPAAIEPGNCALDDPAFWEDHEPFGMIRAFDDFCFEAGEDLGKIGIEKRALIRAVGEQFLQEWEHSKQRG